jgi:hypothetical protein
MADKAPKTRPPKLFKYRSMSTDDDQAKVKDILLNNRLYFPTRSGFNDPFDCRIPLTWDNATPGEVEGLLSKVFKNNPPPGWNGSMEDWLRLLRNDDAYASLMRLDTQKAMDSEMDAIRILCLCERPDDILMWSHYGGSHGGICLEFQVLDEKSCFGCAKPVDYPELYPKLGFTMDIRELLNGLVLTKAAHWKYEGEWRIVDPKGADFYDFRQDCLSGVVLGCQIAPKHEALITEWLSKRISPVTLYRAEKANNKFAVEIKTLKVIGPTVL